MITNDRQYRISKAQAQNFFESITKLKSSIEARNKIPILVKAELDGLKSQYEELKDDLNEYKKLKDFGVEKVKINSFDELPLALIKLRIAQGLSQKALAERLGLKEQQIQRYEATNYEAASLARIKEVLFALKVKVNSQIFAKPEIRLKNIFSKLSQLGITKDFIKKRLLPVEGKDIANETEDKNILYLSTILSKIYYWNINDIISDKQLKYKEFSLDVRFKVNSKSNSNKVSAHTYYIIYLAQHILDVFNVSRSKNLFIEANEFRKQLLVNFSEINFENVLRYVWSQGVPVVPINEAGSFHGACIRFYEKNIIFLKQQSIYESRWVYDLLHEFRHAMQKPKEKDRSIIEEIETLHKWQNTDDEIDANNFAADVLLNSKAEILTEKCVELASGNVKYLKKAIIKIALDENVSVEALANYMAYRLTLQNINWWGAATNLQSKGIDPWGIAVKVFHENIDMGKLEEPHKSLLLKALQK